MLKYISFAEDLMIHSVLKRVISGCSILRSPWCQGAVKASSKEKASEDDWNLHHLLDSFRYIKQISRKQRGTWNCRDKTFPNQHCNSSFRDLQAQNWRRAVEERNQKKAWLLCGIEEIEIPRGFQRKNPKGSLVKNIFKGYRPCRRPLECARGGRI